MKHHIVVTGTGRTGSTFLIQLLTKLGLDTGFNGSEKINSISNAGLNYTKDILEPKSPYIIKQKDIDMCRLLIDGKTITDLAVIPMRELYSAAESRRNVQIRSGQPSEKIVSGGLWGTSKPSEQEAVLAERFHELIYTLTIYDIPIVFLEFPKLALDAEYLFCKLDQPLGGLGPYNEFLEIFHITSDPNLIHDYNN